MSKADYFSALLATNLILYYTITVSAVTDPGFIHGMLA